MIRTLGIILLLLVSPKTLAAEKWTFVAGDAAGKAVVTSPGGTKLLVDCGNSGEVGIAIVPDIRPVAAQSDPQANFILVVDGNEKFDVPMSCQDGRCSTGGQPGFLPVVHALRAGSWVEVRDAHRGLDAFSLSGSSSSIEAVRQSGCPGF